MRRPIDGALRHTIFVLRTMPHDFASVAAVGRAVAGLPWVIRERKVISPRTEAALRLVERPQQGSQARRYVG
ncbi:MAG TPA: hypothetical protein VFQ44_02705 [Streptosporangiaceae bacterium]|nr:hypothetical protein [Streptosporangiaceae bacterium]